MKNKYGHEVRDWKKAKAECIALLADVAKARGRIAYSDLAPQIKAIEFEHDDPRFWHLLGEVSIDEMNDGRGMLSAIVVHKHGDMRPGPGFYELAKWAGKEVGEVDRFWLAEFNRVHDVWANKRGTVKTKK
jgi:hypothetical protein